MKKTLITSTALVLLAGAAAAQVSFSGFGRFGIAYDERQTTTGAGADGILGTADDTVEDSEVALVSRFRLNIDGMATTDGGVEFSARVRLQADEVRADNEQGAAGLNGARFSVQYGGFRVDAGNVAGSFDNMPNYYGYEPGLELFTGQYVGVDYNFLAYTSTGRGANAVYASYTAGGFFFGASYDQDIVGLANGAGVIEGDRWDIGAAYTFNNFTGALTYGENDADQSLVVLTLAADFDRFSGTLFVGDEDMNLAAGAPDIDGTVYGLSLSFDVGAATSILASYGGGEGDSDTEEYGIGFIHDLGGGVSLRGGIGYEESGVAGVNRTDGMVGDFCVLFNF